MRNDSKGDDLLVPRRARQSAGFGSKLTYAAINEAASGDRCDGAGADPSRGAAWSGGEEKRGDGARDR